MTEPNRMTFSTTINAPVDRVWRTMLEDATYREWTSVFAEGSAYEGSWEPGAKIRFTAPGGDGMVAEIAEHRPREYVSIRHLGMMQGGQEDTTSAAVRSWAPIYENYRFREVPGGTEVVVEMDSLPAFDQQMRELWPKALARLKEVAERE